MQLLFRGQHQSIGACYAQEAARKNTRKAYARLERPDRSCRSRSRWSPTESAASGAKTGNDTAIIKSFAWRLASSYTASTKSRGFWFAFRNRFRIATSAEKMLPSSAIWQIPGKRAVSSFSIYRLHSPRRFAPGGIIRIVADLGVVTGDQTEMVNWHRASSSSPHRIPQSAKCVEQHGPAFRQFVR